MPEEIVVIPDPVRMIEGLRDTGYEFTTAIAETYQDGSGAVGPIDRSRNDNTFTLLEVAAPVVLLDLESGWLTRAGGNQAVCSGPRHRSREWARAIHSSPHPVCGLAYNSSVWGPGRCVALWEPGAAVFPPDPLATRRLMDPGLAPALANAAIRLRTFVI